MKRLFAAVLSILLVLTLLPITTVKADDTVSRLSGKDRYKTSLEVADELKRVQGIDQFDTVILATGKNYADALGGGYLAAKKGAPILLTNDKKYNDVNAYIRGNLKPDGTVYVLGGTGAVPDVCLTGLEAYEPVRLFGKTRYDTNMAILNEAGVTNEDILICSGENYADALAASAAGRPMLLVNAKKNVLNDVQKQFLSSHAGNKLYIIGGAGAVSADIEAQVSAYGTPERISGSGRYETSVAIAETFYADPKAAVLAYSNSYPDGLCAGPLAYTVGAPILLLKEGKEKAAKEYAAAHSITSGYITGGTAVIPDSSADEVFGGEDTPTPVDDLAGTYDITVWVRENMTDLTEQQINDFMAANPGIVLNATVNGISETEAAEQIFSDPGSAADLYCLVQDQLTRLVQVNALDPLNDQNASLVKAKNDTGSVRSSFVGNTCYAYPMSSDNGYIMYYDKNVISEDIVDSLENILAACEANGRKFSMQCSSAWYNASFFLGTGCVSEWSTDANGSFNGVHDTYNSDQGLAAMKAMQKLVTSPVYANSGDATDFGSNGSAVVITGTWSEYSAREILGDRMGVTDLPGFTVDGKTYHMGSFSGHKLVGVKPQTDPKKAAVLHKLALYLTDEKAQKERCEQLGWVPSNKAVQNSAIIQGDPSLSALVAQSEHATPQRAIHGSWWDIAGSLYRAAVEAESEDDLRAALSNYESAINSVLY